jgi:EpsI family protein
MRPKNVMGPKSAETRHVSRRSLILGAGFAATAGVAAAITPHRHEEILAGAPLKSVIPQRLGPWTSLAYADLILPDSPPTDVYGQVMSRAFQAPGWPSIMLVLAYGEAQSGLMKVHRPEVCYTSAGFKIVNDQTTSIPVRNGPPIPAKSFLGERQDRKEYVLYWTRISNAFPTTLVDQRLVMFEQGLRGVVPDGVLVRLSTVCPDWALARAALLTFATSLITSCPPQGRALLVGLPKPMANAGTA